jgi:hypothetical protein
MHDGPPNIDYLNTMNFLNILRLALFRTIFATFIYGLLSTPFIRYLDWKNIVFSLVSMAVAVFIGLVIYELIFQKKNKA